MAEDQTAPEPTFKVFAGNLAFATTDETLKTFFSSVAEVVDAHVVTRGNRSLGYGFVDFKTLDLAEKAVKELDKKDFEGRTINVEVAKPRTERAEGEPRRGRSRGRGRRGGRGRGRGGYTREEGGQAADDQQAHQAHQAHEGEERRGRGRGRGRGGLRGGGRGGYQGGEGGAAEHREGDEGAAPQGGRGPRRPRAPRTEGGAVEHHEGGESGEGRRGGFRRGFRRPVNEEEGGEGAPQGDRPRGRGRGRGRGPRGERRPPPENQTPSQTTLFIANLAYSIDEDRLKEIFQKFKPKQSRIARIRDRSKGFGFVELETHEMQTAAAAELDNTEQEGRVISVKVAVVDLSAPPAENGQPAQQQ